MRIENESVRLELDRRNGGFASIYDKRLDWEYIGAPERCLLFRLIAPKGELLGHPIDAANPCISVDGACATLTYDLEGVHASVELKLTGAALDMSLTVSNAGDLVIEEIMFPWVRGVAPVDNAAVVWPNAWISRFTDIFGAGMHGDHRSWEWGAGHGQQITSRYPVGITSAWMHYGNATQGLALESRHTDFSIVDFFLHKIIEKDHHPLRRTLEICLTYPRRVKPGETWRSPPIRMSLQTSDWHAVAAEHRDWLKTWIPRPTPPARFAEALGWHFFFMKNQDGVVWNTYQDLPALAAAALEAGCPYLLIFGWQTGGHDNNYLYRYFPNDDWGGADALRAAVQQVRDMGVDVFPFFNGTLANTELPEHKEFGRRWEVRTRGGHPIYAGDWARYTYDTPTQNRAMHHHEICPCAEHREYFLETVRRIVQDYGFGNLQLDQVAQKMWCCYNEEHGHSYPDRAYIEGFSELLSKTRELVRQANPSGAIITEGLNEFARQWCDGSWDWRSLKYPEPILYTLPWVRMSNEIDALEYREVNMAFAYKMHLDLKFDGGFQKAGHYPEFANHLRRTAELKRRIQDYYVYAEFRDEDMLTVTGGGNAFVKMFLNSDEGKMGIVVAETEGEEEQVTIGVDAPLAGVVCESNQRDTDCFPPAPEWRLGLKPWEIRVLCIDLAG